MNKKDRYINEFLKIIVGAVLIGIVASVVGLIFNVYNPKGIPLDYRKISAEDTPTSENSPNEINANCEPIPAYPEDIFHLYDDGEIIFFIDTRDKEEYEAGHIKDALNIPLDELYPAYQAFQSMMPRDGKYVFYCNDGCDSSMEVADFFCKKGYLDGNICVLDDGYNVWVEAGYPVE